MNSAEQTISFARLFAECGRVEVPLIQRDYAQGRVTENEVRHHFLTALHDALMRSVEHPGHSLNLDFVYGSKEGEGGAVFLPLDGQQRLTTLFLLHWYLGWRDMRLPEFRQMFVEGQNSRFRYAVRRSSTEFFDELVRFEPRDSPDSVLEVRALLEDQPWFFLRWRLDPTIQSALVMLDAIHARFASTRGLFEKLVNGPVPAITFQLLPLEHFGLTDDLYIKMNARGKPLTVFETFKARFEEALIDLFPTEKRERDGVLRSVPEYFENQVDTIWTDLFWTYKDPKTNTFDVAIMNLVVAVVRISLDPEASLFGEDTTQLRSRREWTFSGLQERSWITKGFAENLIVILDAWSKTRTGLNPVLPDVRYLDERNLFERASREPHSLDYLQLVLFAALTMYLREHAGNVLAAEASEWMRVVYNLASNSDIERPEQFGRALLGLQKLSPFGREILTYLAANAIGPIGFSPNQVQEEALKAKLIRSHTGWRARIETAEGHGYFAGQIDFLLDFCGASAKAAEGEVSQWTEQEHLEIQEAFDAYLSKCDLMFHSTGLTSAGVAPSLHLWKRALLACGDYLVTIGSNRSFLTNPPRSPDSWKRFLRSKEGRRHVKNLLDRVTLGEAIDAQLNAVIDEKCPADGWRAALVRRPQCIEYCGDQEIRSPFGSQKIYLLAKRQMNGMHAELFSYSLYLELSSSTTGPIAPLKLITYMPVSGTYQEPYIAISFESARGTVRFSIESTEGRFLVVVYRPATGDTPEIEFLRSEEGFTESPYRLSLEVERRDIVGTLQGLGQRLRDRFPA